MVKLNRKPQDVRSGISDLNWYHSSAVFTFDVKQEINSLPSGTYGLKTYIMAIAESDIAHDYLDVYVEINGVKTLLSMKDKVIGWGPQKITIFWLKLMIFLFNKAIRLVSEFKVKVSLELGAMLMTGHW